MSHIAVAPQHLTEAKNIYTLIQTKVMGLNRTNFRIFVSVSFFLAI